MVLRYLENPNLVLIVTNVGEEGLDMLECYLVIFYDSVSSAIRRIQ